MPTREIFAHNPETAALAMQTLNLHLYPGAPPTFVCLRADGNAMVSQKGQQSVLFVKRDADEESLEVSSECV